MLRSCETRSGKRQSALRVWSSLIALVIASSTVLADSVGVKAGPRVRAAMGGMDCPRTSRKSRGSECRRPPGFAFLSVAPTTPPLAVDDRNGKVWIFLGCEGVFSATCFKAVRILCHLQVSPAPVTPTFTDVDPSRISPPGHRGARLFRPHGRLQPPAVLPDRQLPAPAWRSSWSKTPGPPIPEFGLLFVLVVPSSAAAFGRPSCLRTSGSRARRPFGPSSRRVRPSRKDCLEPRKVSPERAPAAGRESGLESAEGRVWCN